MNSSMTTTNKQLSEQLGNVRQELGKVLEGQRHAEAARGVLHEKIDKVIDTVQDLALKMAEVSHAAALATSTAAQTRDRVDALDREMKPVVTELSTKVTELEKSHNDAAPLLDTVKQARNLLAVLIVIASASGIGLVGVLAFFNDAARDAFRTWLGI